MSVWRDALSTRVSNTSRTARRGPSEYLHERAVLTLQRVTNQETGDSITTVEFASGVEQGYEGGVRERQDWLRDVDERKEV